MSRKIKLFVQKNIVAAVMPGNILVQVKNHILKSSTLGTATILINLLTYFPLMKSSVHG